MFTAQKRKDIPIVGPVESVLMVFVKNFYDYFKNLEIVRDSNANHSCWDCKGPENFCIFQVGGGLN